MIATATEVLNSALAAGAILGGIAYALGQLISARKKGASDALRIAVEEVDAIKIRVERLEKENVALQAELHELKKENQLLRGLITNQGDAQERLLRKFEELFAKQTKRLVEVIREGRTES